MTTRHSSNRHVVGTAGHGWSLLEARARDRPPPEPLVVTSGRPITGTKPATGRPGPPGPGRRRSAARRRSTGSRRYARLAERVVRAWRGGEPVEVLRLTNQLDGIPREERDRDVDRRLAAARRWARGLTGLSA